MKMDMDDQLTIFSQNCRGGLSVATKRRDLFHYVRTKKYNIICLQDVHINSKMNHLLKLNGVLIHFSVHIQQIVGEL